MAERNVYRGRILVLSGSPFGGVGVEGAAAPRRDARTDRVPAGVLERIERHTKTFAEHADALSAQPGDISSGSVCCTDHRGPERR